MSDKNTDYCIVLCTCPDTELGQSIAAALVQERLAACVNLIPNLQSVYLWKDAVEQSQEVQLVIKSRQALYPQIEAKIRELHRYELPEIITVPIMSGLDGYLQWIDDSTRTA